MIIGGHGKVAQVTIPRLAAEGHQVTAVIRSAEQAPAVEALGATAVVADVEQLDTVGLGGLVVGSDAVVWSAGAGGGDPARTRAVDRDAAIRTIDSCVREEVERFVMVSYSRSGRDEVADDNPFVHYARAKAEADAHLQQSTLNWTILGPGQLTDEPATGMIEVGEHVTGGKTSRENVAQVIAEVTPRNNLNKAIINFRDGEKLIAEVLR